MDDEIKNNETCSSFQSREHETRGLGIIQILKEKHDLSGGNCGLTAVKIKERMSNPPKDIKPLINDLERQGKLTVNPGGQGDIIMLKV